jgi:hypothetical protein
MKNKLFTINFKDLAKGFITSVFTGILTALVVITESGSFPTYNEFIGILKISLIAGIGYLIKNILTNSDDKFLKKEA